MPGEGPHLRGAISISPGVDYMERAYDQAKYGEFSRRPYMDMVIPTLTDPSVAPPGKHILSCFVQYAPYKLASGTWDDQREAFGDTVIDTIAEYAPNIRDIILHRQVLTPLDIERDFGLTEGNIFQGELTLEQLFFARPVPGWSQYRTPVRESVDVRIGDASRRRHHGRAGAQLRAADPRAEVMIRHESTKTRKDARAPRRITTEAQRHRGALAQDSAGRPRRGRRARSNRIETRADASRRLVPRPIRPCASACDPSVLPSPALSSSLWLCASVVFFFVRDRR